MNQTKILLKKMMILIIVSAFFTAFFGIAMPVAEAIPNPTRKQMWYDQNGLFNEKTIRYGRVYSHIRYDKNGHIENIVAPKAPVSRFKTRTWYENDGLLHIEKRIDSKT